MKLALIGYGKMGLAIEEIALQRGHEIVAKVNSSNPIENIDFSNVDLAIEFSRPELAPKHILHCVRHQVPIVVGTTAWQENLTELTEKITQGNGAMLHASNFSVGVNIFFEINRILASFMDEHLAYTPSIEEVHHLQKLDAPSGTAISLAKDILFENRNYESWLLVKDAGAELNKGQFAVVAHREPNVPGTHIVKYESEIDSIEIKHQAHNRKGFAQGAVLAAEWLLGRKGVFTMSDVIKLK